LGRYGPGCVEPRDRLRDALGGDVASAPAALPDLIVGGRRLQAQPEVDCGAG
jgi:hypothetical protein